jgi:hypothetical protein
MTESEAAKRDREYLERVIDERDRIYQERYRALEALVNERDRQYDARFKAQEVAVSAALAASEKAVNAAFSASEKAVLKAEQAQKEYNERSNEFRGQLDDQAKTLMPRPETLQMFKSLEEKLASAQNVLEGKVDSVRMTAKTELDAARTSFNKAMDMTAAEIISLREFRSEGGGKELSRRAFVEQRNWMIGVLVAIGLAALGLIKSFWPSSQLPPH